MSVTYIPSAERSDRWRLERAARISLPDLLLIATSCIAAVAIGLAYVGRIRAFDRTESARSSAQAVNLNTVTAAALLEPALGSVFTDENDRRFAARGLFRSLVSNRDQGRVLPNVGAIALASVAADAIGRSPRPNAFEQRLAVARESAAAARRAMPQTIGLLTAADIATLKPFFVVRTRSQFRQQVALWSVIYLLGFPAVMLVRRMRGVQGDGLLLAAAHLLTAVGFATLLSRPDPLRDVPLFVRYVEGTTCGLALMTGLSLIDFRRVSFLELSYIPLLCALLLSVLLIAFGGGPGRSNAKVNLGPIQPIEAIRLLLALFLAGYFARRWELLRGLRGQSMRRFPLPAWINLPRSEYVLPVVIGVFLALAFFFVQKDLGPALLLCCVFLALYAIARGRIGMAIGGFVLLAAGFYVGYHLNVSDTLAARVRMWQSPWDNSVSGGDQVAHALWAMASGGPFGTGLGLGDTRYLPAGHTDLILGAIGEELGLFGLVVVAAIYAIVAWRGFRIARSAPNDYGFFLGTALTLFLVVPVLVMAAGIVGITPLTGVVTPFLSYGGSAMAANFSAIGMLSSIDADPRRPGDSTPFHVPLAALGGVLAVVAAFVLALVVNIQVLHADEYAVRPHLGVQADGGRRYEYNPRVVDLVRQIPRGTIYDRRGIPLATSDPDVIARARQTYKALGVSLDETCVASSERCYPLGGRTFHLLGDEPRRLNWSAPNSSYVERDAEDLLRGFDERTSAIETTDSSGRPMLTIRRDYRELVPLLRHRYQPDHPAVVSLLRRSHDVRLTIDAAFQSRVASIVASYAKRLGGKGAAVVLDPDTGALLATVSYPWPALSTAGLGGTAETGADPLLDRARYGLYPPGSTFKLVTASAALRQESALQNCTFTCVRLPDGRVGAKIKGWSRPVRDDVRDTHPHGTIDMHEGLVHSCNAYFAQLAMKLGPGPLVEAVGELGISLTQSSDAVQRVRDTLPQIGYGQGEVVATPVRMARVAAAIAADGALRETYWQQRASRSSAPVKFLEPAAARLLASYLRDSVTTGTGSSLRGHAGRIAGKTGTAELSGRPSHGWFVGFAPYGPAARRIAFAIVMENAGYGGATAAPVAGEIVTAAAQAGLIK